MPFMALRWLIIFSLFVFAGHARAQDQPEPSKVIRLVIGFPAGAGYDLIGRMVAKHMGDHLSGKPKISVENMPGAGGLRVMNFLANLAPRDGTSFGLTTGGVILEPTLNILTRAGGGANFNIEKMGWLGNPVQEPQVIWVMSRTGIQSFADLRKYKNLVFGASAPGSDAFTMGQLSNRLLGTQLKIVTGYDGVTAVFLSAERGEVDGGTATLSAIKNSHAQWLQDGTLKIVAQFSQQRTAELPDVPTAVELANAPDAKAMLNYFGLKFKLTYAFVLPPGLAADKVAALQTGFDTTMNDAAFKSDLRKIGVVLNALGSGDVKQVIREAAAADGVDLAHFRSLLEP